MSATTASHFPRSPRISKGAIISFESHNPIPKVILFQYNPESLARTISAQSSEGSSGEQSEPFRLKGPPVEAISIEIELDATDQLEFPDQNQNASTMGISPQLSALELILYPKSSQLILNSILSLSGELEILPPEGPFTIFSFGPKRMVPVRLTEFRITEEFHDVNLNPIRAKVSLEMRILSSADLPSSHPGHSLFLSHQIVKEAMGALVTARGLSAAGIHGSI
jgi:hypothetical protein